MHKAPSESSRKAFQFSEEPLHWAPRLRLLWVGGALGHGIYWIVWSFVFPQPHDSLALRGCVAGLWFLVGTGRYLRTCSARVSSYVHYAIFILNVPFFFSYMYLANGIDNRVWAMSFVCAIYLTFFSLRVLSGLVCFAIGSALAVAVLHLAPAGKFAGVPFQDGAVILPIFLFAFATAVAGASRRDQRVRDGLVGAWRALAVLAHEVRSPMFALRMQMLALKEEMLDRADRCDQAWSEILDRLERRISDVHSNLNFHLENVRWSSGEAAEDTSATFDLAEVARDALDTLAGGRNVPLIELRGDASCVVRGDIGGARQIVVNLLRNAITAVAAAGGGKVSLELARRDGWGVVTVEDSAGSLSAALAQNLFVPFFSAKKEGIGVGLYASRMIAERMGGAIQVMYEDRVFTRFQLELPSV